MTATPLPPSPAPAPSALRLVLDTNTVMALWAFEDPKLAHLRALIDGGAPRLLVNDLTLEELRRVLAYRQFGIPAERQAAILAAYAARATVLPAREDANAPALPACRDADDQKFLELARDGGATHLVSRDKLLLKLNRHRLVKPLFAILSPEALQDTLRLATL
ncbi:putative toxin-antitoxin system toxin component, PIN family [Aromatoleum toluclasticum]|uniref:putative toxin-antitoxin system toxin component, PIN family n=1 Tax=Aromatoleum toluclasticum TaxID=92003 RepID=UPI00059037D1|nr:putative toxin-antitoxin system toxin component, PIN family [Aromatoleum toluclasticum]